MTRLLIDNGLPGFAEWDVRVQTFGTVEQTAAAAFPYWGGYGLDVQTPNAGAAAYVGKEQYNPKIALGTNRKWAYWAQMARFLSWPDGETDILRVHCDFLDDWFLRVAVANASANGADLLLYFKDDNGDEYASETPGLLVGSNFYQWHWIVAGLLADSTGSAGDGEAAIWLDDKLIWQGSGWTMFLTLHYDGGANHHSLYVGAPAGATYLFRGYFGPTWVSHYEGQSSQTLRLPRSEIEQRKIGKTTAGLIWPSFGGGRTRGRVAP